MARGKPWRGSKRDPHRTPDVTSEWKPKPPWPKKGLGTGAKGWPKLGPSPSPADDAPKAEAKGWPKTSEPRPAEIAPARQPKEDRTPPAPEPSVDGPPHAHGFARAEDGTLWAGPWAFEEYPLRLRIDPALALGLTVEQVTREETPVKGGVGDVDFDLRHQVRADDLARVVAFLHPQLRDTLVALRPTYHVVLDDEGLVLRWRIGVPESLDDLRRHYVELATAIEAGRSLVPADEASGPLVAGWQALAQQRELRLWHAPLGVGGRVGEAYVRAGVWPHRRGFAFRFTVRRDVPLAIGLSVTRAGVGDKVTAPFRRGPKADRDVGEARFDEVFDIRTTSTESLGGIFDKSVRAVLLARSEEVPGLRLHDYGAEGEARGAMEWAMELPRFVDDMIDLVELIARNAATGGAPESGPYR